MTSPPPVHSLYPRRQWQWWLWYAWIASAVAAGVSSGIGSALLRALFPDAAPPLLLAVSGITIVVMGLVLNVLVYYEWPRWNRPFGAFVFLGAQVAGALGATIAFYPLIEPFIESLFLRDAKLGAGVLTLLLLIVPPLALGGFFGVVSVGVIALTFAIWRTQPSHGCTSWQIALLASPTALVSTIAGVTTGGMEHTTTPISTLFVTILVGVLAASAQASWTGLVLARYGVASSLRGPNPSTQ